MRTCPACGASYDVSDAICPVCEAELPAPYETVEDEEIDPGSDDEATETPTTPAVTPLTDTSSRGLSGHAIPSQVTILSGVDAYLPDGVLNGVTVVLVNEAIVNIIDQPVPDPQDGAVYYDLTGKILAPGFIDVHVHGMMGIETVGASVEDFIRLSQVAAQFGITSIVPTTVACSAADLALTLVNLHSARQSALPGAHLLGLHMESNFINPQFKGAQPEIQIMSPDNQQAWPIRQLIDEYASDIRIITLAPEVPGVLEFIPWLLERKISVSLGHSSAIYEEAMAGFDAGANQATHIFNAMPPLHHRKPGLVGAALENNTVYTELICDGIHIHPSIISTVITAKGADRVIMISDGLSAAGTQNGEFTMGGQHVSVRNGVAWLDNGTIAGSIATMDAMVRLLVGQVGWDLGETLLMASTTPAEAIGLPQLGRIAPRALADLVVLSQELEVEMTLVSGKVVYQKVE